MNRRWFSVVALVVILFSGSAMAGDAATPVRAPTGFKNYCEGGKGLSCPRGGVPRAYWRPAVLPVMNSDGSCPANRPVRVAGSAGAAVLGSGPAHLNVGYSGSTMYVLDPPSPVSNAGASGWHIGPLKVGLGQGFRGPYVVRGGRIDGPGAMGFSGPGGKRPYSALQVPRVAPPTRGGKDMLWTGGYVWLSEPGCYAIQLDAAGFSHTIAFRVEFTASGGRPPTS